MSVYFSPIARMGLVAGFAVTSPVGRAAGNASSPASATVHISLAAKQLNAATRQVDATGGVDLKTIELKSYINSIDFRAVSPAQMNELACRLVASGELGADQVSAFMGIENDTVQPQNAAEKIDVTAHFKMMYAVVEAAAKSDSTLNFGVQWRGASIDLLGAVQRFASSDRAHIHG